VGGWGSAAGGMGWGTGAAAIGAEEAPFWRGRAADLGERSGRKERGREEEEEEVEEEGQKEEDAGEEDRADDEQRGWRGTPSEEAPRLGMRGRLARGAMLLFIIALQNLARVRVSGKVRGRGEAGRALTELIPLNEHRALRSPTPPPPPRRLLALVKPSLRVSPEDASLVS